MINNRKLVTKSRESFQNEKSQWWTGFSKPTLEWASHFIAFPSQKQTVHVEADR